jgi:hypothetical protein
MAASTEIRSALVSALEADLVGPFPGVEDEILPIAPSRWYLTGFLAPQQGRDSDNPDDADEFSAGTEEDEDETPQEPEPKQKATYPASMGMSVLLPAADAKTKDHVTVTVSFADYIKETVADEDTGKKAKGWRRVPQPARTVSLPLDAKTVEKGVSLPDTPGIVVCGKLESAEAPGLPAGTRALSVFVVNQRTPEEERGRADEQFIFQVSMEIAYEPGFLARPNRTREASTDTDDGTADLQFRDHFEWAVGHGAAVQVPAHGDQAPRMLRTTWIPRCEVRKVETHEEPNVVTAMEDLAAMAPDELVRALSPLTEAYARFIAQQAEVSLDSAARKERRKLLLKNAARATLKSRPLRRPQGNLGSTRPRAKPEST